MTKSAGRSGYFLEGQDVFSSKMVMRISENINKVGKVLDGLFYLVLAYVTECF